MIEIIDSSRIKDRKFWMRERTHVWSCISLCYEYTGISVYIKFNNLIINFTCEAKDASSNSLGSGDPFPVKRSSLTADCTVPSRDYDNEGMNFHKWHETQCSQLLYYSIFWKQLILFFFSLTLISALKYIIIIYHTIFSLLYFVFFFCNCITLY